MERKTRVASRVVSLVPALTETVRALGAGDRLVGVSDYDDSPSQTPSLPRVGTFLAPVVERVLALQPDAVLTSPTPANENAVRAIERAGVRVVVIRNEGSLAALRRAIARVAELLARRREGQRLLGAIDAQIERARGLAKRRLQSAGKDEDGTDRRPRVAVVVGREPLVLAGPGSYLGELVDICGGRNIAAAGGGRWPHVGLEAMLASQPEVIVDLSMGSERLGSRERLRSYWGRFPSMPAVAHHRLYVGAADLFQRPGPRIGEAALALVAMIYPPVQS